jgi:phenylacetyl-CoA:acceptor oxidoreductase subunit 1
MSMTTTESASPPKRWGMVVDLNRCVGCQTCTIACKHANDTLPDVQWRQVLDVELGAFPNVERLFLVTGCQHCEDPPCVPVCPTGATAQRADGLVTMDYDLCIGCSYCAVSCPYQARTIVHEQKWYFGKETVQEKAVEHPDRIGVMSKCTFCVERIDDSYQNGGTPGVDPDVTPACAASCIAKALHFGDYNNPESNVSTLVRDNKTFKMHEHLGTNPQINYIYDLPNSTPGREATEDETGDEVYADPAHALTGKRQTFWDWKAAANFILGGVGSGLIMAAWLGSMTGVVSGDALLAINLFGGAFMALGLATLLFKIGRPLRILSALRRPQSSWMTREMYVAGVFFVALALVILPRVAGAPAWSADIAALLNRVIAAAAFCFLYAQGQILRAAKGIPTWRAPLIPWMLFASGLFEGLGLLLLIHAAAPAMAPGGETLAGFGVIFAAVNFALWQAYRLRAKRDGIGPLSRADLASVNPGLVFAGHAAPLTLLLGAQLVPALNTPIVYAIAGAGVLFGGWLWKLTVITKACHQQGFAVPRLPQRGSGTRAAPARMGLKP